MVTVLALLLFALLFVAFALLGPAERSKPCGGKGPKESPCAGCPLASDGDSTMVGPWDGCPGPGGAEKASRM
jgi:hypothetical protein